MGYIRDRKSPVAFACLSGVCALDSSYHPKATGSRRTERESQSSNLHGRERCQQTKVHSREESFPTCLAELKRAPAAVGGETLAMSEREMLRPRPQQESPTPIDRFQSRDKVA